MQPPILIDQNYLSTSCTTPNEAEYPIGMEVLIAKIVSITVIGLGLTTIFATATRKSYGIIKGTHTMSVNGIKGKSYAEQNACDKASMIGLMCISGLCTVVTGTGTVFLICNAVALSV